MKNKANKVFIYAIFLIPLMVLSYCVLLLSRMASGGVARVGDDVLVMVYVLCGISVFQLVFTGILVKKSFANTAYIVGSLFSVFVILLWGALNISGTVYGHSSITS